MKPTDLAFQVRLWSCIHVRAGFRIPTSKKPCTPLCWNISSPRQKRSEFWIPLPFGIWHPCAHGILHSNTKKVLHPDLLKYCIPCSWRVETCVPLLSGMLHPHSLGILHSDPHRISHPDVVEFCIPVRLWNLAFQLELGSCIPVRSGFCIPTSSGYCIPPSWNISSLVKQIRILYSLTCWDLASMCAWNLAFQYENYLPSRPPGKLHSLCMTFGILRFIANWDVASPFA